MACGEECLSESGAKMQKHTPLSEVIRKCIPSRQSSIRRVRGDFGVHNTTLKNVPSRA